MVLPEDLGLAFSRLRAAALLQGIHTTTRRHELPDMLRFAQAHWCVTYRCLCCSLCIRSFCLISWSSFGVL